jgi:hypothetical protein
MRSNGWQNGLKPLPLHAGFNRLAGYTKLIELSARGDSGIQPRIGKFLSVVLRSGVDKIDRFRETKKFASDGNYTTIFTTLMFRESCPSPIDERLFARLVLLSEHDINLAAPLLIMVAEVAEPERGRGSCAAGSSLPQAQRTVLAQLRI